MFTNIGGKIKTLAKVLCWIGIVASLIGCIVISIGSNSRNSTVLIGLAVLIAGCIGSWVGSFFIYGFGELIQETTCSRMMFQQMLDILENWSGITTGEDNEYDDSGVGNRFG